MNILLLAKKNPWPPKDGEAIAILQMAKGLAANGNRVTVLYMNTPKHHFDAEKIQLGGFNDIHFQSVWVNSDIKPWDALLNLVKNIPYHTEKFFSNEYLSKLISIVKNENFDIIQAEGLYLIQYLTSIPKSFNTKFVYRSHNQEGEIWKNIAANSKNPVKKWYLKLQSKKLFRYENLIVKNVDAIVPISISDTVHYKNISNQFQVHYSPTGIDIENIPDNTPEVKGIDLYFIGGLDWLPNTEGLLWFINKIFPSIKNLFPDIQLHIAGRNAPIWLGEKVSGVTGLKFYGEVPNAFEFIQDKFICIVPLLSGSGMKLKIMEAMAVGKPVITTVKGAEGMPTGVDEHISVAVSEVEFIRMLSDMIHNKVDTIQKAKAAKHFVIQHLNNITLTKQLTQFYSKL